jgi:hypothetical protein
MESYFESLFNTAAATLSEVAILALSLYSLEKLWKYEKKQKWAAYTFAATLMILLLSWWVWARLESKWLDVVTGGLVGPLEQAAGMAITILVALLFVGMALTLYKPLILVCLFLVLCIGSTVADFLVIEGVIREKQRLEAVVGPRFFDYYLKRPIILLHIVQFLIAVAALIALFAKTIPYRFKYTVAYLTLSVAILVNEVILWWWRYARLK